ncbi:hypothetical protein [Edaphobacter sp.]|uniref:hypothetical protein n=1 Tax=Edaphobacter sp. TaxID=1934404 RepID=UPI002DBD9DF9|nr:hypothetical protein [Edaphobacter sp.]HEU5340121.1 hypothetical protein [Edaphobacter sp.]
MLEGTSGLFSICCFLFIIIAGITFNLAGGFTRATGSYVFAYAILGAILGFFWKAILGEPADSNLLVPQTTIEVYLGGICSMLAAVYVSRKLATKRPLLGTMLEERKMQNATVGCMLVGILIVGLSAVMPHGNGTVLSALQQVDRFLPLAIIIGVTYQIRKSKGTSSINLPVVLSFAFLFFSGVVGFSKEGMLTPFVCWLVAACCMRYRVSIPQIIGGILTGVFIFQFLVPFSQYGRLYRSNSFSDQLDASIDLLSRLGYVRQQYKEQEAETNEDDDGPKVQYYDTKQGFFDRLQMLSMDDALINVTQQGHVFGIYPILASFENLIPRVFWPNKPRIYFATMYAQEIGGLLPEDDTTTGISFTPTAEGFHLARWAGVFVVAPIIWTMLFTLFDSLCGDVRQAPWGLLVIPIYAHLAPEGGLSGIIYILGYGTMGILFTAFAAAYVMPIIGTMLAGPEAIGLRRSARIRSIPSRRRPAPSPEV